MSDIGSGGNILNLSFVDSNDTNYGAALRSEDVPQNEPVYEFWEGVVLTTIQGVLCVFGLTANVITFFAIGRSTALKQSPFNILIMSLCVSDFLSALNSPLQIYRKIWGYSEFNLPNVLCKITTATSQWTLFVTIQHIVLFSIFRLIAVQFPHKVKVFTTRLAAITAAAVWIILFFVVFIFYSLTATNDSNNHKSMKTACTAMAKNWRPVGERYTAYVLPTLMFIPFIVTLICTILIVVSFIQMRKRRSAARQSTSDFRQSQERMALIQVTLIICSFLLGYSTEAAFRMTRALKMRGLFTTRSKWLVVNVSYVLLRLSECLNPVFYNLASNQIRNATKIFLSVKKSGRSNSSKKYTKTPSGREKEMT